MLILKFLTCKLYLLDIRPIDGNFLVQENILRSYGSHFVIWHCIRILGRSQHYHLIKLSMMLSQFIKWK